MDIILKEVHYMCLEIQLPGLPVVVTGCLAMLLAE